MGYPLDVFFHEDRALECPLDNSDDKQIGKKSCSTVDPWPFWGTHEQKRSIEK